MLVYHLKSKHARISDVKVKYATLKGWGIEATTIASEPPCGNVVPGLSCTTIYK